MVSKKDRVGSPGTDAYRGVNPGIDQSPAPGGPTRSSAKPRSSQVIADGLAKINALMEPDRFESEWSELIAALKRERHIK